MNGPTHMNALRLPLLALILVCSARLPAQEMQPRAYLPSPVRVGFAGVSYSYSSGSLLFDPSLPVEDARVQAHTPNLSVGGSFSTWGRSSQVLAVMPYVVADLTGKLAGAQAYRYRSGLADTMFRYAVNLYGAPAMTRKEFRQYRQKTIVGVSLTATAPASQYDPNRVINTGTNRWALKPEVGVSKAFGQWTIEGAFGAWLYTRNGQFMGNQERTQKPLWSTQAHVVRTIHRRHWLALDFTYFQGGTAKVNGQVTASYAANTRMGGTYGLLITPRQAIRFSYFKGVTTRLGSDIQSIGVAYQFLWADGR